LLERLKRGRDAATLAEIVRRYGGMIHGVCVRRVGPEAAASATVAVIRELVEHPDIVSSALPVWLHASALRRGDGGPGPTPVHAEPGWDSLAPALDPALASLPPLPRWYLLTALCMLPPRSHAAAYVREFDGALAQPIAEALRLLAQQLGPASPGDLTLLQGLLERNVIELPPPALAGQLGRLALGALPTTEREALTPGARRAKVVWSIAVGGLVFAVIMAVVFWAISLWSAGHRKPGSEPTPATSVPQ
jgi:hypothetical protein